MTDREHFVRYFQKINILLSRNINYDSRTLVTKTEDKEINLRQISVQSVNYFCWQYTDTHTQSFFYYLRMNYIFDNTL